MPDSDAISGNAVIRQAAKSVDRESLEQSRLKRAYRHMAARQLLHLSDLVGEDKATEIMNAIDEASLDTLPHWCLLEDTVLLDLQRIAGAVFTAPAIRRCIDGSLLGGWQSLLGAELFDRALAVSARLEHQDSPFLPEARESLLLSNGSSVLLSTVQEHPAYPLLENRFAGVPVKIPEQTALAVYTLSASLQQQFAQAQQQAPSHHSEPLSVEQNSPDDTGTSAEGTS